MCNASPNRTKLSPATSSGLTPLFWPTDAAVCVATTPEDCGLKGELEAPASEAVLQETTEICRLIGELEAPALEADLQFLLFVACVSTYLPLSPILERPLGGPPGAGASGTKPDWREK